jgi:hypothetical protein
MLPRRECVEPTICWLCLRIQCHQFIYQPERIVALSADKESDLDICMNRLVRRHHFHETTCTSTIFSSNAMHTSSIAAPVLYI